MTLKNASKKILVIDDNEQVAESMVLTLLRAGFEAEHVTDTTIGFGKALSEKPNAVVIDVMLNGGQDGFALAEQLHRHPETKEIKIILITTPAGLKDRRKNTRVKNFLTKPFKPSELIKILQQLGM